MVTERKRPKKVILFKKKRLVWFYEDYIVILIYHKYLQDFSEILEKKSNQVEKFKIELKFSGLWKMSQITIFTKNLNTKKELQERKNYFNNKSICYILFTFIFKNIQHEFKYCFLKKSYQVCNEFFINFRIERTCSARKDLVMR
jgi:hypothetical protein